MHHPTDPPRLMASAKVRKTVPACCFAMFVAHDESDAPVTCACWVVSDARLFTCCCTSKLIMRP